MVTRKQVPRAAAKDASSGDGIPLKLGRNDRFVLEALKTANKPISAYDLIGALKNDGIRFPVTVYRALNKLISAGLVHRIETENAFVACDQSCNAHGSRDAVFAVCGDCGQVAEFAGEAASRTLAKRATDLGFDVEHMTVELRGRCTACRTAADQPDVAS